MKKILAVMLAVLTVLSVSVLFASANEGTNVFVTITDKDGKLALAYEKVTVTDIDGDNTLTVNDALYAAHEQFFDGGAAAGYTTEMTKYGLSLVKLWGNMNGYNYGYMINDLSAWSMTDPVKENDYVAAYNFTDNETFADKYAFFDVKTVKGKELDELTLTLKKNDFDMDWNPVVLSVAGAEITIDGKATGVVTDEEGKATIAIPRGKSVISATAKDQVLVPPVCLAEGEALATPDEAATEAPTVIDSDKETEAADETVAATEAVKATEAATKDSTAKGSTSTPKTGDATMLWLWILIAGLCLCGIIVAIVVYKKKYAKK